MTTRLALDAEYIALLLAISDIQPASPKSKRFTPKQMLPQTAEIYHEIFGTSTADVAKYTLEHLLPPIPTGAVIHDNACGTGEVTSQIMALRPPADIIIKATDINSYIVSACLGRARAGNWPVEAFVMQAEALAFPDNYFSHSFSNFLLDHLEANHNLVAKQIHRTLMPGGAAIVSTWAEMAHGEPIKRAHIETRGPDVEFPVGIPDQWHRKEALLNFFLEGGFTEECIEVTAYDFYIETRDLKHLMTATWSFWGQRTDGWYPSDEEYWDTAIDVLVEHVQNGPYYHRTPEGNVTLRMVANVGIARK